MAEMAGGCVDGAKGRVVAAGGRARRLYVSSGGRAVAIAGAWAEVAAATAPARTPALALDHESLAVGMPTGAIYRLHFVGSHYGRTRAVGDATIDDLQQLRTLWADLLRA
jgi:pyrimidine and pyridine-specific 5'-nucleotidase